MFVLIAISEALLLGISPVLPAYAKQLSLSGFGVSVLLASTNLALLVVGVPAGLVADRVDVRRMTLLAGVVYCLAALAQAVPFSYAWLLADRVVVGAACGVFVTAALAWLAALPEGPRPPLGRAITAIGVGLVFGPGIIGLLAQAFGIGAPFLFLSATMAAMLLVLASVDHRPAPPHPGKPASFLRVLAAGARRPKLRAALTALSASAIASSTMLLILPLELHADGESTGAIGAVLFVTGLGYIAASAVVTRLGARVVTIRAVAITSAALGVFMLPASLGRSAAALVLTVALITPLRGAVATLCYELGPRAAGDGVGAASIIGFMGSLWGAVTVVVPLAAGAIYDMAGGQTTFLCAQAGVLAAAGVTAVGMGRTKAAHAPG